jgi:mono/diheme cytochrome c family protein
VSRQNPKIVMGPLARVLYLAGKFPLAFPHDLIPTDAPAQPEDIPATADAAYGSYLAQGCVGCHRPSLKGGPIAGVPPDWPPAADISADTGRIARWDFEQFKTLMRTGTTPDGRKLNPMFMPWMNIGRLEDVELQGLFAFLQSRK